MYTSIKLRKYQQWVILTPQPDQAVDALTAPLQTAMQAAEQVFNQGDQLYQQFSSAVAQKQEEQHGTSHE